MKTRSQKFIEQYKMKLDAGADFLNVDSALMSVSDYEQAKLKVLICFGSPVDVKSVSATKAALNDYVITNCPGVFIDFAYLPSASDMKLYDKCNIPYAIGQVTHLDASHFDVVGFSISVLCEVFASPVMLNTFSRCDSPIPLTWTERKDLSINEHPIIYAGGITAACGDIMYGELGDGRQAFMDFSYLGEAGKMNIMFKRLIEAKETGKVTRHQEDHDVPGTSHKDLSNFESVMSVTTHQDFIDSLFDLSCIYQPQAYEVKFNDKNQVISNKKINPKAQDFVVPYYPHKLPEDLGIGRAIVNANGDAANNAQIQVSEGAMLKGSLLRTNLGFRKVEEIAPAGVSDHHITNIVADTTEGIQPLSHAFNHGVKKLRLFTLKSGIQIGLTDEHPVEQWEIGRTETFFKRADELVVGDMFISKPSSIFGQSTMTTDEAEFLGRMLGDGSYNLYDDPRGGREPHHKMYLSCDWSEKEYCEDLLKRASIKYSLDEDQGRHCRFWIMSEDLKGRKLKSDFWGFIERYGEWENHVQGKKYIPKSAYNLTREGVKAFLKGFHDADGCTSIQNGLSKVTFDSCHEHIVDFIQQLLLSVGIPSKKHYYLKHRDADEGLGFRDTYNDHWSLVLSSEYFDKFNELGVIKRATGLSEISKEHLPFSMENIRDIIYGCSINTEQRSKAFAAVRRGNFTKFLADKIGITYPDFIFDEIVSIEEFEGEVYDVTVPTVEKIIANGLSIHNCSASGACSFCAEGNYTGGWVEKPKEQILKEAREARRWNAASTMKPYSFNMLAADTIVPIGNGRFDQIKNIKDGHVLNAFAERSKIGEFLTTSKNEYFRIKLSRGLDARMSLDHKQMVLTTEGLVWKKASDLKVGDWIPQLLGYYSNELDNFKFSLKAYFLGLWFGDGNRATTDQKYDIQNFNPNETDLLKFCKESGVFSSMNMTLNQGALRWVYKKEYTEYFKSIFPDYKYSDHKLTTLTISELCSFTRGWFDADGCSSLNKSNIGKEVEKGARFHVAFAVKSEPVARFIGTFLNSIGINFHLSDEVEVTLDGYDKVYKRKDLTITGLQSRQLFKKYIGFTEKSKFDKINDEATKWSDKDKTLPGLFGIWTFNELEKISKHTGHNVSKFFHGIKGLTESRYGRLFGDIDILPVRLFNLGYRFSQIESIHKVDNSLECVDINEPTTNQYVTEFGLTHNSLLEGTRVPVGDGKFLKIEDVTPSMRVVSCHGKLQPMSDTHFGTKPVFQVSTEMGTSISMTDEHRMPVLTENGIIKKFEKDLQVGDYLLVQAGYYNSQYKRDDCAYYFGQLASDQSIKDHKRYIRMFDKGGVNITVSFWDGFLNGRTKYEFTEDQKELAEILTMAYLSIGKHAQVDKISIEHEDENGNISYTETTYTFSLEGDCMIPSLYGQMIKKAWELSNRKEPTIPYFTIVSCCGQMNSSNKPDFNDPFFNGERDITCQEFIEKYGNQEWAEDILIGLRFTKITEISGPSSKPQKVYDLINVAENHIFVANGYLSSNCNYVTDYKGMLYDLMGIYPKASFINMRMEELGRDLDALRIMKLVGANRVSAPIEGLSPRIQNNLLNKCLSEESMWNFLRYCIDLKMQDIKVGGIFTGYEEDEDFQYVCDMVKQLKNEARGRGRLIPVRFKVTPLVHYNLTPIEYLERKSAKLSYEGERWLTDEWYEKFKENEVSFKVNGFRYSTFIEQWVIDMGRAGTALAYKHIIQPMLPVYSLRSIAKPEIVQALKDSIDPNTFFADRDPEHYISLSHRIHIELMGSYIPRARRLVRLKKEGKLFENQPDIRCLKTYEGAKTMCQSKCIVKDPLKVYNDVEMDEDGNLHGEWRPMVGCERCESTELKMQRLKRPIVETKNSDDLVAKRRLPKALKMRMVIERNDEYSLLSPANTSHIAVSHFLQLSDELLDMFHSIELDSNYWECEPNEPYVYSGVQVIDVLFTSTEAEDIMLSLVDQVNARVKTFKVVQLKREFVDDKLKVDDWNIYRFDTDIPLDYFRQAEISYKGDIKVMGRDLFESIQDKSLITPAVTGRGKTIGYYAIPCKYNPLLAMQGLLKDKKFSINDIKERVKFKNCLVVRQSSAVAKGGKEKSLINLISGKNLGYGLKGIQKALLALELKK